MGQELYTHECCPPSTHLHVRNTCFFDDIVDGYEKLYCYGARKFGEASPRTEELAISKFYREPFQRHCACMFKTSIKLVYTDPPFKLHTRSAQLALPSPRKLVLHKKEVCKLFCKQRLAVLNRLLRKSYFSMYSRLMNVTVPECQPPKSPDEIKKRQKRLAKLNAYLSAKMERLAEPKQEIILPPIPRESKDLGSMLKRIRRLSQPIWRYDYQKPEWVFTKAMNKHKATDREKALSKPREIDYQEPFEIPRPISPNALKYKISPRVNELSEPKTLKMAESDLKENPFAVSPTALKYRITKRMKELAEPKEVEEGGHIREHPSLISPAALTYKATPRIISLAKPKE